MNDFSSRWLNRGDEKSDTQSFWNELLHDVLGLDNPTRFIIYEKKVQLSHVSFIDAYIPSTRIIIEQKSREIDPAKPQTQSDGTTLTPFEQAKRYYDWLPASERGRYIIVSNFRELRIHDMETPKAPPSIIPLEEITPEKLAFLVAPERELSREEIISLEAGRLAGKLRDSLNPRYVHSDKDSLQSLNVLCVRIVFLLYADHSGIFAPNQFRDFLKAHSTTPRTSLLDLFRALRTDYADRDPYLDDDLAAFPYINGGLFDGEVEIPKLDSEPLSIIIDEMSVFTWNEINPTIFGAIFESTLNDHTRKTGGMHYTTTENIHKVINPLFLDELNRKLEKILKAPVKSSKPHKKPKSYYDDLLDFQDKLASLTFLDPACGSGNFLTETYLSLRRLENRVIEELSHGQRYFAQGDFSPIKVKISQFYGIELDNLAASVAKTALWIAEHQMVLETHKLIDFNDDFIPLKTSANIENKNAISLDWSSLIPPDSLSYIMGNPPFRGARIMEDSQKKDIASLFTGWGKLGDFDYVCCWYKKAFEFMKGTKIKAALVSTNSINQGDTVSMFWKRLIDDGLSIDFAHQTFIWDSEAEKKAHVNCVIIGFSACGDSRPKRLYVHSDGGTKVVQARRINAYLLDAPDWYVFNRELPLCGVPAMRIGNKPIDDGNYLFTREQYEEFIKREPESAKYFHLWYGGQEFLHNCPRMCLYLGNCTPHQIAMMPECRKRVEAVRQYRLSSKSKPTQKLAETPTRFHVETFPKGSYIVVPKTSSEKRKYIPMGFLDESVMCGDALQVIPDATLYHFGVLESLVHMSWMRIVAGRLEMRYRYSSSLVYNCFVWPSVSDEQRERISRTARGILEARGKYADSSLAELYDEVLMPVELRRAHRENDEAVSEAYGFGRGCGELEVVGRLMEMYEVLRQERG